jgi:hypothetical protein
MTKPYIAPYLEYLKAFEDIQEACYEAVIRGEWEP